MTDRKISLAKALQIYRRIRSSGTTGNRNMAWRCSGNSNEELVNNLERGRIFTSPRVREAMLSVDRADFTDSYPYQDSPQGIGWNATISAPHMHAAALEGLEDHLVEGAKALDIGSGTGYLTVCMAKMVGPRGKAIGVEHIGHLVDLSIENVNKNHSKLLKNGNVILVEGDGRLGYEAEAPYNAIHVGAAAEHVPPALTKQLAEEGRMLIPVGREHGGQVFLQIDKINGELVQKVIEHVIYVPLTSKSHQLGRNDE